MQNIFLMRFFFCRELKVSTCSQLRFEYMIMGCSVEFRKVETYFPKWFWERAIFLETFLRIWNNSMNVSLYSCRASVLISTFNQVFSCFAADKSFLLCFCKGKFSLESVSQHCLTDVLLFPKVVSEKVPTLTSCDEPNWQVWNYLFRCKFDANYNSKLYFSSLHCPLYFHFSQK